jgi:hypothetical protein
MDLEVLDGPGVGGSVDLAVRKDARSVVVLGYSEGREIGFGGTEEEEVLVPGGEARMSGLIRTTGGSDDELLDECASDLG